MLRRNYAVRNKISILLWVENFRPTGLALQWKPPGRCRNTRNSGRGKNLEIVYNSVFWMETVILKSQWIKTVALLSNNRKVFFLYISYFGLFLLSAFKMWDVFLPHTAYICIYRSRRISSFKGLYHGKYKDLILRKNNSFSDMYLYTRAKISDKDKISFCLFSLSIFLLLQIYAI